MRGCKLITLLVCSSLSFGVLILAICKWQREWCLPVVLGGLHATKGQLRRSSQARTAGRAHAAASEPIRRRRSSRQRLRFPSLASSPSLISSFPIGYRTAASGARAAACRVSTLVLSGGSSRTVALRAARRPTPARPRPPRTTGSSPRKPRRSCSSTRWNCANV